MNDDIECPYCGELQDIDHDDGYGYEEDETYHQECNKCGKTFVYTTGILYVYHPEKADCLNGGQHDYQLTHTYPKECSKMRCLMCDDERQCTKEEREKHGLDIEKGAL
jgi:hypothetical protein